MNDQKFQSAEIDLLAIALTKAQSSFPKIGKNKKGYGYKYADLESILDATREGLVSNDLAITQYVEPSIDNMLLVTMLIHKSGQFIRGYIELLIEDKKGLGRMQNLGVAMTYARRYGLQSILGISADEDTDGVSKSTDKEVKTVDKRNIFIEECNVKFKKDKHCLEWIKSHLNIDWSVSDQTYWDSKLNELKKISLEQVQIACQ